MILNLILLLLNFIIEHLYVHLFTKLSFELINEIIKSIHKTKLKEINKYDNSYLTDRITGDCKNMSSFIINLFNDLIVNSLMLWVSFAIILYISPKILYLIVILIFLYYLAFNYTKNFRQEAYTNLIDSESIFYQYLKKQISSLESIRIYYLYNKLTKLLNDVFYKWKKNMLYSQKINYIYSSLD